MSTVRKESDAKDKYLKYLGYNLVIMRECNSETEVEQRPEIKGFLRKTFNKLFGSGGSKSEKSIIDDVESSKFFGFVECDIAVPPHLHEKFGEMSPIFKNIDVVREDIGDHMRDFAVSNNYLKSPQRMLVGSLKGEKVLLFSELLRWYIKHGLVVSKVYQTFQYNPRKCYEAFGTSVSDARREGDIDSSKALLADTSKLVGNSFYGKTITNKEKHRNVVYIAGSDTASAKIRNTKFVSMEEVCDDFYEIVLHKRKVRSFLVGNIFL